MNRIEIFRDKSGEYRWHFQAANNRILADSGEGYENKRDCIEACETVTGISYLATDISREILFVDLTLEQF